MSTAFETYYKNSPFVYYMLMADKKADEKLMGENSELFSVRSKKRGRGQIEDEGHLSAFLKLVKEWDHANLFPTFKVFVDQRFYMQMALNDHREGFRDVALATQEFRQILAEADKLLYHMDYPGVYGLVVGKMFDFLVNYQQLIIVWNLQCNS